MLGMIRKFIRGEEATTALEYSFIVALISIAVVGGFTHFANEMEDLYIYVESEFVAAQTGG